MTAVIYARYSSPITSAKNPSKARFVNARPMPKRMTSLSSSTYIDRAYLCQDG